MLQNYNQTIWPSTTDLRRSEIDKFAALRESITLTPRTIQEVAYAQYFNKMVQCVNKLQEYVVFTAAASSGTGLAGQPLYPQTCPAPSSGLGIVSDGSVNVFTSQTTKRIKLSELIKVVAAQAGSAFSNTLPWELVITGNMTVNYSGSPVQDFILQDQALWDLISGSNSIHISVWLEPNWVDLSQAKWHQTMGVVWHGLKSTDHLIIRGSILDQSSLAGEPVLPESNSAWHTRGQHVNLCVSILTIT